MEARGPFPGHRQKPKRRWVASHWGTLLLIGVVVILIVGSALVPRLVYRYSPEGRLRSYIPEAIRGTCEPESTSYPAEITFVATEGYPTAIAGLMCFWRPHPPELAGEVFMTYLLFEDRDALLHAYPAQPTSCRNDEAGRRICLDPDYFGPSSHSNPYHGHIIWTDGTLFLTDVTIAGTFYP
jgi:hypothetical protein